MDRRAVIYIICQMLLSAGLPFTQAASSHWRVLYRSIGISAMHMQLLHNDRVVMFDGTDFGPSNLSLPQGICVRNPNPRLLRKIDCTAHSVEYNVAKNTFRPLKLQTDVWCSSGSVMRDGTLIQTGGFRAGERRIRIFKPCLECDWEEIPMGLRTRRWYATNHVLPDGRQIVIGGRKRYSYEFIPKTACLYCEPGKGVYSLPFLVQTNDPIMENNLYPFVFLHTDGNLFIFANNRAILFDYAKDRVLRSFPEIPGGDPRSYPSTGSAVLLPLNLRAMFIKVEVLICGGAPKDGHAKAKIGVFVSALKTCARMEITNPNPHWVIEEMPMPRVMGDMLLLPNGNVLLINGAKSGTAGWELGRMPALIPVIYRSNYPVGLRFELNRPTKIPRLYHSTAILLRDGRVLVGGSNPHAVYNFTGALFPTELSLEAFYPTYLDPEFSRLRPKIRLPKTQVKLFHREIFKVRFVVGSHKLDPLKVSVTILAPPFNTHSFSMNQRLLVLDSRNITKTRNWTYEIEVTSPVSGNVAPSGYYILFVVYQAIPSVGIWVQIL